ncbi:MAG: 5-oxoprolinase subunit PxpA [Bacteroidota bacterium]
MDSNISNEEGRPLHINCDMGESFGRYRLVEEELLMPYIDACNIACGFHAGDPVVIESTIKLALEQGLEIGAHPSYPDQQGFGRRFMEMTSNDITAFVCYQVCAVKGIVESLGGTLSHVKPHGALYNRASKDELVAGAIIQSCQRISPDLILYLPPSSRIHQLAVEMNATYRLEGFIDRHYNSNLQLKSRSLPDAVITDPMEAREHALGIWNTQRVCIDRDKTKEMSCDTMCIHGDNPNALQILKAIRD